MRFIGLLLRPPDPYLPRPQRARGLRARDRRQGQRPRAGAGRACARPSWQGEHVALGTNTDPYQWVEGRYRLMEGIWEAMRDYANPCSILTKSPLLLRDIALMKEISERTDLRRQPLDPDARREGVAGDRAAHASSAQANRSRRRARPGRNRDRRPDRAADARDQRLAGASRGAARACSARQGPPASAGSACTCAARSARSGSTGCASTARTWFLATRICSQTAPTCARTNAERLANLIGARRPSRFRPEKRSEGRARNEPRERQSASGSGSAEPPRPDAGQLSLLAKP